MKDDRYISEWSRYNAKSVCTCGHTGDGGFSQHVDTLERGHGRCQVCDCTQFTWAGWTEKAKRQLGLADPEPEGRREAALRVLQGIRTATTEYSAYVHSRAEYHAALDTAIEVLKEVTHGLQSD